jgi:hypothetical protein
MNIYTFQKQFIQQVQPPPTGQLIGPLAAWNFLKDAVRSKLDEPTCTEFGFAISAATHFDGKQLLIDENQFQVYFGALIDAARNQAWHTAEINFYYRYPMYAGLRQILLHLQQQEIETAFCSHDDPVSIQKKLNSVFTFADGQTETWRAIQDIEPAQTNFHFWIQ